MTTPRKIALVIGAGAIAVAAVGGTVASLEPQVGYHDSVASATNDTPDNSDAVTDELMDLIEVKYELMGEGLHYIDAGDADGIDRNARATEELADEYDNLADTATEPDLGQELRYLAQAERMRAASDRAWAEYLRTGDEELAEAMEYYMRARKDYEVKATALLTAASTSDTNAAETASEETATTTTTTSIAPRVIPTQYSRSIDEWTGLTYGSEYVDGAAYFVLDGELTEFVSFAAPHTLGMNDEWDIAYFHDVDAQRAYAVLGTGGFIGAALEYDYADGEHIGPPLCWDDAFGPVVFTHDPVTFEVLRAWHPINTESGNIFISHVIPSALTPDIDGYFVSGGNNIPSCSG